ncbi:NADPH-dependent methylglyoxal reductase Gre2p [Monosporozyma unispora]|nr:hypothetical protein C6P44_001267 [Kazachstania unispora]
MTVLVSGANGYIAEHIVNELLNQDYKVIGTVRSEAKADKLFKQFGSNPNLILEVVEDISDLHAFDEVFKKYASEIKYVLHTASPFTLDVEDYVKELFIPALHGVKAMLHAVEKYGATTVERFVLTSSYAAIMDFDKEMVPGTIFTETSWNPDNWEKAQESVGRAYNGSKVFAEREAWNFIEEKGDRVKFKLSVVNPVYVFGPHVFDEDVSVKMNTSCEIINKAVHTSANTIVHPFETFGSFVDVRDVARAHLLAFQRKDLIGKRLLMDAGRFSTQDIFDVLNQEIPVLKGKVPVGKPGTGGQHNNIGATVDNRLTCELLGFEFTSFKKTIVDTAQQILKHDGSH